MFDLEMIARIASMSVMENITEYISNDTEFSADDATGNATQNGFCIEKTSPDLRNKLLSNSF